MPTPSVQLKEPITAKGGLIGSFYSGKEHTQKAIGHCTECNEEILPQSKFCGECGTQTDSIKFSNAFTNPNLGSNYLNEQRAKVVGVPNFAQISPQMKKAIPPQMKQEYCKLSCLIARERAFLLIHYLVFLFCNLFGLWCACKAYNGLVADEFTRLVVAFIPIFCINLFAFSCIVPINGTKREISRLKERLTYLHYQMEYANLA